MEIEGELLGLSGLELDFLIKNGKRCNLLRYDSLVYLPYWLVKVELPDYLSTGELTKAFECLYPWYCEAPADGFSVNEVLGFILWLRDALVKISEMEMRHLSLPPDPRLIKAGVGGLEVLGEINVVDTLAGGDILKWDSVKGLPYHQVFDKLLKMKLEHEIQLRISRGSRVDFH